jgi:glucoamylase
MPRDIPIGNGRLLINFDDRYQLRDFYYPHVGSENHSAGYPFRFGVWCEGQFSWTSSDDWTRRLDYQEETLVTNVRLDCPRLGLSLHCEDAVDFHETIYIRRVGITNHAEQAREVRLFFHQDFRIKEYEARDTAFYHPDLNVILHYKENRNFLINGLCPDGSGIREYATGIKGIYGKEGTWRDAEDGVLERNPIAQGSVDSAISLHLRVEPGETAECYYWICVDDTYEGVKALNNVVQDKHPATLLHRTAAYWNLWVNKDKYDFSTLTEEMVRLYKHSLLILRTQIDANGAIIAASDSDIMQFARDTYCYVWPRDGALVAEALDRAGYPDLTARFFNWCRTALTRYGFFLHKYNPDGSAGSSWHPWIVGEETQLPVQEDETALVVWAIWKHFERHHDVEAIKPFYRELVIGAGEWMLEYRDPDTGLPLPSYDLWEERRGVPAWTVGAVYGALTAIVQFARLLGEENAAQRFETAAQQMKEGVERHFWQPQWNRFARMIHFGQNGEVSADATIDASMVGLFLFGMFEADDPKMVATMEAIREQLWVHTDTGGLARYTNDTYHQVSHDIERVPGNTWFIGTLWLADYLIARAGSRQELEEALPYLEWCVRHAMPSGVLAEQLDPYTGNPLSVSPLTWSHAAFVTTVQNYLHRSGALSDGEQPGERQPVRMDIVAPFKL